MSQDIGTPQGRCGTTLAERFAYPDCNCGTYEGNLGPCKTYVEGMSGRCVYCEHGAKCHEAVLNTFVCAACQGVFKKGWTDEAAAAEATIVFPELNQNDKSEAAIICDDCYQEFMAWMKAKGYV